MDPTLNIGKLRNDEFKVVTFDFKQIFFEIVILNRILSN